MPKHVGHVFQHEALEVSADIVIEKALCILWRPFHVGIHGDNRSIASASDVAPTTGADDDGDTVATRSCPLTRHWEGQLGQRAGGIKHGPTHQISLLRGFVKNASMFGIFEIPNR
jgi:hypothetical protein